MWFLRDQILLLVPQVPSTLTYPVHGDQMGKTAIHLEYPEDLEPSGLGSAGPVM